LIFAPRFQFFELQDLIFQDPGLFPYPIPLK
jgi:hypothetical protein